MAEVLTIEELRSKHAAYYKNAAEQVQALNKKYGKQVVFVVPVAQAVGVRVPPPAWLTPHVPRWEARPNLRKDAR